MKSLKAKLVCLLATASLFAAGPCQVDSWNLAFGPVFSGDTAYGGVELEFSNGFDLLIPLTPLGNNFD